MPKIFGAGLMLFALAFSLSAEAKLCKWVDGNGEMHYGDAVPPEYASTGTEKPDRADVVDTCNQKPSPEMIQAKEEAEAKKLAARKEKEEKRRRANALRSTYSNEKEIDIAFERNSALIRARIEAYDVQLKSVQGTLDELTKYVDDRGREGKTIPQSVYEDISQTEATLSRLRLERAKSEAGLESMRARSEEDKILYRKIIVLKPEEDAKPKLEKSCTCPVREDAGKYSDYRGKSRRTRN
ncbi:MAG: DUF4124 domain-containing protein [Nitrosomonadales bacterium]|nr:DUF4124 domain-containing protein [Nitrosomonadales bacterium]